MRAVTRGTVGALILALAVMGCGDDDSSGNGCGNVERAVEEVGDLGEPELRFRDHEEGRYCEVLIARTAEDGGLDADVYNSIAFGSCPQDQWERLEPAAIAQDFPGAIISLNGPRFFLMQEVYFDRQPGPTPQIHTFGEITMATAANVNIEPDSGNPYTEIRVDRDNTWRFEKGRRVFELQPPTCETWIMQSFSRIVDPDLSFDDLSTLGDSLVLPPGWSYRTRILDTDLDVGANDGVATVLQDELRNTYQLQGGTR